MLGPDSALVPIILAVVLPLAAGDPGRAVTLAAAMALVSGLICIGAGLLRLGFITELLSKPIRYGYMNGIALAVLVSQAPKLFGISGQSAGPLRDSLQLVNALLDGKANWHAFALGAGTLVIILLLKRWERLPGILIAVVAATGICGLMGLEAAHAVKVVGSLPQGLPGFALPLIGFNDLATVAIGGAAVALVSFADTSVLSRTYAAKTRAQVDPNQKWSGWGWPIWRRGSSGHSHQQQFVPHAGGRGSGARSQLAGVFGALGVAALLLFAPDLLRHLPQSALAAVVIAAAIGLFEFKDLARIYRIQRWEFWLSITCFVGVAVFGAVPGIGLAVVIAVIEFLWDGWRPHYAVLGRVDGIRGYHDVSRYPDARRVPGLVLFRWDAPLFFANAELFQRCVLEAVARSDGEVRRVVVAAEPVTSVDVTSADMLVELEQTLREAGVELHFAEVKDPVRDKLLRLEVLSHIGSDIFQPTVGAAVDTYLQDHAVDWTP